MYNKEYRENNKDKMNENQRRYDIKNRKEKERQRLMASYGITPDEYMEMLLEQDGCCAICGKHQSDLKISLSIDHDHKCCPGDGSCGKCIRGLLCSKCNTAIAMIDDSVTTANGLTEYLVRFDGKYV